MISFTIKEILLSILFIYCNIILKSIALANQFNLENTLNNGGDRLKEKLFYGQSYNNCSVSMLDKNT
jgi:hypothetical protein